MELITSLTNPLLIPHACRKVVVQTLMYILLESPRRRHLTSTRKSMASSRWSPSQDYVLQVLVQLYQSTPSLSTTANTNDTLVIFHLLVLQGKHARSPHSWNRILSVFYHVAGDCPVAHQAMTTLILQLLQQIDNQEIQQWNHPMHATTTADTEASASPQESSHRPRKRIRTARLSELHDNDYTTGTPSSSNSHYRLPALAYYHAGSIQKRAFSVKDVLKSTYPTPCSTTPQDAMPVKNSTNSKSSNHEQLRSSWSKEWATLRIRAYKKLASLLAPHPFRNQQAGMRQILSPWSTQPPIKFGLSHLLQAIRQNYQSPSLRLILLFSMGSSNGSHRTNHHSVLSLTRTLWQRYMRTDPFLANTNIWLRIYAECLCEWSYFDSPTASWKALEPLVQCVHQLVAKEVLSESETNHRRDVFNCLASILVRKSSILQTSESFIATEFQSFLDFLSLHCGEHSCWFYPIRHDTEDSIVEESRDATLRTLQRLGILGLMEASSDPGLAGATESEGTKLTFQDPATQLHPSLVSWPFHPPYDVRSALSRARGSRAEIPANDNCCFLTPCTEALSPLNDIEDENISKADELPQRNRVATPIHSYIHNPDLLLEVFQYLKIGPLLRCRSICHSWKSTIDSSNNLWSDAYRNCFEVAATNTLEETSSTQDWSSLFIQKWTAEANLLHKRNISTGWKHRTCKVLGCYHVLKSEGMALRHYRTHERNKGKSLRKAKAKRQKVEAKQTKALI